MTESQALGARDEVVEGQRPVVQIARRAEAIDYLSNLVARIPAIGETGFELLPGKRPAGQEPQRGVRGRAPCCLIMRLVATRGLPGHSSDRVTDRSGSGRSAIRKLER